MAMIGNSNYAVGQVAQLLVREKKSKNTDKPQGKKKKKQKLEALFTVQEDLSSVPSQPVNRGQDGYCPPAGIVHESVQAATPTCSGKKRKATTNENTLAGLHSEVSYPAKRPRKDRRDKTNDHRTVFVGNLPTNVTKKVLMKLFKPFGEIESLRIRCAPRADLKMPKKLAIIKKEFHPERHNLAAFVLFKSSDSAQEAVHLNGHILDGYHMRVDLASSDKQHDHQRSVFVGNLPFDAEEEDVRLYFQEYGDVENVRLIRDRNTSVGKGFGYVLFKDKSSVGLTLKFGKHKFKGRDLRVQRSTENPVKKPPTKGKLSKQKAEDKRKAGTMTKVQRSKQKSNRMFHRNKASRKMTSKKKQKVKVKTSLAKKS